MHEIRTQVDIQAGASLVWSVLTDFSRYPDWNPTIRGVQGPLDLSMVGVLARLATTLAGAGVSMVAIGTFDTDYVLVRDGDLPRAMSALAAAGYAVA